MDKYILDIIMGVIGIILFYLAPEIKNLLKAAKEFFIAKLGQTNYYAVLDFVRNEYTLHKDLFTEDKIAGLIEILVTKFGAKISEDTIKKIIDLVIAEAETAIK